MTTCVDELLHDEIGGAVIRSLAGNAELRLAPATLYLGQLPLAEAAAHHQTVNPSLVSARAQVDGFALRARFSKPSLHAQYWPDTETAQLVYECLEQLRVESLVPEQWPGMRANLNSQFEDWMQQVIDSGLAESDAGMLILTVATMVWTRLNSQPIPDKIGDWIESTRANLGPVLGDWLYQLRKAQANQKAYAPVNQAIAVWVAKALAELPEVPKDKKKRLASRNGLAFRLPQSGTPIAFLGGSSAITHGTGRHDKNADRYKVFTQAYDEEVRPLDIVRTGELQRLRSEMDASIRGQQFHLPRLIRQLRQWQLSAAKPVWETAQESGILDTRLAHKLVTEFSDHRLFQSVHETPTVDTSFTLLIDCSGSMKGLASDLSIYIDLLCRAAERAGLLTEVLGYTTVRWNGGRSQKLWQQEGSLGKPGRLADRRHIVFKSFDRSWRDARMSLAGLRKVDLFKEGIDGEALQWAAARLAMQSSRRKELLVISDGCPMESSSQNANDSGFLENHLASVAAQIRRAGGIRLRGVGVGVDLTRFYPEHLKLDLAQGLSETTLQYLSQWLTKPTSRRSI
jgi:cobaltochelatase CobT